MKRREKEKKEAEAEEKRNERKERVRFAKVDLHKSKPKFVRFL